MKEVTGHWRCGRSDCRSRHESLDAALGCRLAYGFTGYVPDEKFRQKVSRGIAMTREVIAQGGLIPAAKTYGLTRERVRQLVYLATSQAAIYTSYWDIPAGVKELLKARDAALKSIDDLEAVLPTISLSMAESAVWVDGKSPTSI